MQFRLTRRAFLALSASSLSVGAIGDFHAPLKTPVGLPPQWELLEQALEEGRLGSISFAHIAFDPARPTDLWAVLSMLHASEAWPLPSRTSVLASNHPTSGLESAAFIATIEINPQVRLIVDARHQQLRSSAIDGSSGRLLVFPARAEFENGESVTSKPVSWKSIHEYTPPLHSAAWSFAVCEAIREAGRLNVAVSFKNSTELVPANNRTG